MGLLMKSKKWRWRLFRNLPYGCKVWLLNRLEISHLWGIPIYRTEYLVEMPPKTYLAIGMIHDLPQEIPPPPIFSKPIADRINQVLDMFDDTT